MNDRISIHPSVYFSIRGTISTTDGPAAQGKSTTDKEMNDRIGIHPIVYLHFGTFVANPYMWALYLMAADK